MQRLLLLVSALALANATSLSPRAQPRTTPSAPKNSVLKLRGGGDLSAFQAYFHLVPAAVLILPQAADILGLAEGNKIADMLLLSKPLLGASLGVEPNCARVARTNMPATTLVFL